MTRNEGTPTVRRLALLAATLLLAPASLVVGTSSPAAGLDADPIVITPPVNGQPQTFTMEYPIGTVVGNEPSGEVHTPDDCAMIPTCARIPVTVQFPDGYDRELEEFIVSVSISWEAGDMYVEFPGRPAGQDGQKVQGNDLDNWFYVVEEDEEGATEYRQLAQAATASNPEVARWLGGADEYVFSISNYLGVNRGFKVTITTTPAIFGNPIEDLGTGFRSPSDGGSSSETASPTVEDLESFEPGPAASLPRSSASNGIDMPDPVFTTTPGGLPVIGADTAETFGAFGGSTEEFEAALDGEAPQLFQPAREVGPPKAVSGSLIAFWLGLVPIVLALAIGAWFWRRRPTALSFTGPATPSAA